MDIIPHSDGGGVGSIPTGPVKIFRQKNVAPISNVHSSHISSDSTLQPDEKIRKLEIRRVESGRVRRLVLRFYSLHGGSIRQAPLSPISFVTKRLVIRGHMHTFDLRVRMKYME